MIRDRSPFYYEKYVWRSLFKISLKQIGQAMFKSNMSSPPNRISHQVNDDFSFFLK